MISSRDRSQIPPIDDLRKLMQSIAMLDAILMCEWEYRYYSYNTRWSDGKSLATMRNGSGDEFYVMFSAAGAIIGGGDHESEMAASNAEHRKPWPGVIDAVPNVFFDFFDKTGFTPYMTFCLWRLSNSTNWEIGPVEFPNSKDPDGSEGLLHILDGRPETYVRWAEEYYERPVDIQAVSSIYGFTPLTESIISLLNPDLTLADLAGDIDEIGYPVSG